MAKLSEQVKTYIVRELACYERPSEIAKSVRTEFGVDVSRQQVHDYNPEGNKGHKLARKWRDLHAATRKAFLEDTSSIPVAHKSFRLRRLNRMIERAEEMGNYPLAAQLMEQAAKECGDAFSNRRTHEIGNKDGESFKVQSDTTIDPSKLSTVALRELLAARDDQESGAD